MNSKDKFKAIIRTCGNLFFVALVLLVIGLPIYIHLSKSNLSYTPEPKFPNVQTNSATGQVLGVK